MLGLASFSRAIAWDEEIIRVLTILSQTITNTQARITAENIRKQNEIELEKWRKRYELAEQASGQMIYEYNFLTNSVIWGANASLIVGYAEPDLPRCLDDWLALIHPEDLSFFQQALKTANINKTPFFCQYRFRHQAGHYFWLEDCNRWLLDEQGEGIGVIGMITDISDEKDVELLLRKQALVFENITDGVIITDMDGLIIDWNRGAENLYGYTKTEMLGKSPSILHKTEEGQRLATEINQTTLQKGHWSGELIVVCKDGTEKITATSTVILRDIQKNNIALIGFNHDITKLKKIEEELRDNNAKLQQFNQELEIRVEERTHALQVSEAFNRQLITEFPIGLACCRLDGQLVYVNPNFAKILGRTVEESLNLTYWDITPIKYQEQEAEQLRQLQETGSYGPYEKEYIHKDGHLVAVSLTGLLIQQKEETFIWSSVQDISDRKQAEQQLQNLTNRLKIALNSGAIGCWEWEIGNSIVTWDERVYELYGIPVETTVVFETFVNSLYPDDRQATLTLVQEAVAGKAEYDTEFRVIHPDGSIHFLKCYGAVMRDDQGNPLRVIGVNFEITEQKQAEQTIRQQAEKETLLRQITQRIRESLNLHTIFDTACQEIRQFIQSDRVGIFKFYPDSGFDDGEFVAESLKEGCSSVLAIRIHDHCFGEDYAKSYTEGHFQVINDVLQSNLQECHKAVLSQFQIRANLVIPLLCGQKLWGLLCIHTCTAPRIWQPDEIDLIQQIAGQLAIAIQQANLLEQLQQELKERQVTQQQLTERNQQLSLSNEELARATRLKDEFLANMSHELRTPLNAILGMTEGLQEQVYGPINPKQLRSLQTIERSGFHLLGLINEILDLAKIESGQLELECGPTAIAPLCRSSLAFIKQQALNKRIQIQTQIPQDLPDIWIDERRIRQVLINLLNNAVKFTPEGGNVTLEATLAVNSAMASLVSDSSPSTQTCLRIAIIDNGLGITPENIPKLFQPFIQVDSALNRQYEGTGLGLALVKRLVELHGGRVSLTSEFGKGSCFTIDLPCPHRERFSSASSPELETENRTESISLQTRRSSSILLVEDNPASASTIVNYLEAKGYRLILAENGEKAIALAQSEKPDLILMDIQMPGMDGLEAIKQIRLNANLAQIPIIALTALAMPGDRDRCLEAGANEYVSKPVRLKQLTSLMQDLLNSSQD
jgi:PAS domain S-box-containing protein